MTLDLGGYALYSVMGICVVFVALILIMAMIKILVAVTEKKAAPAAEAAPAAATSAPEPVLAPGTAGDLCLYDTDPRDAAMVMAIVADELKKPLNELRFISIKEVK
ncbi:MAG: hypothetical protein E7Z99_04975 [Coriobacteriaceae bacterium]|jgi:Na+-transporting methylmalonyl-CoA/oxaloacetate decarboxylase gamma subunit|nr:hypothetical protein [Coriobacteriaceae bacterium]